MAALSFIDVDLGKVAPLAVLGALGLAGWWLWQKSQTQAQTQAAETQASPLAAYQAAADLQLLQSFTGGSAATPVSTGPASSSGGGAVYDPALPTYTAPTNPTQNFTSPATGSQSLVTASTTSNGI